MASLGAWARCWRTPSWSFSLSITRGKIWGEAVEKRAGSKIVSPRSLYGEATPPVAAQPSSEGYPTGSAPESGSGGYPAPTGKAESMANADARAQIDKLRRAQLPLHALFRSSQPAESKSRKSARRQCSRFKAHERSASTRTTYGHSSTRPMRPSTLLQHAWNATRIERTPKRCGWV